MMRTVVVVSIVLCVAACLLHVNTKRRRPRRPVSEPAMSGATVAAVAPAAAGVPMAVDAPAEPSSAAVRRRRHNNSGANRFGPTHANVRPIRTFQTHS